MKNGTYYAVIRNGEGLIASVPNVDKYSFDWAAEMRDKWLQTFPTCKLSIELITRPSNGGWEFVKKH